MDEPPFDPDRLLFPAEVAALFDVVPRTIGRWEQAGILPALRTPGGHRRFRAADVRDLALLLQAIGEP